MISNAMQNAERLAVGPNADVLLYEKFLPRLEATVLMERLLMQAQWRQDKIKLFGKEHTIPRLHQWYGDQDTIYQWSSLAMQPQPWLAELEKLRQQVNQTLRQAFNGVLVNFYRDGHDSMGWHADNEVELGPTPCVASVSLGSERDFIMRYRDRSAGIADYKIALPHGSLLVMQGSTQQFWLHALPKRLRVQDARLNLSFRHIM